MSAKTKKKQNEAQVEDVRTEAGLRAELETVAAEERRLVGEAQGLALRAEAAIEDGDSVAMRQVAARKYELPMQLKGTMLRRAKLALALAELEHEEHEKQRFEVMALLPPLEEAERAAREAREEARGVVGDHESYAHGLRERIRNAREALAAARQVDGEEIIRRISKEATNNV